MKRILRTMSVQSFTEIEDIKVSAQISLNTENETPEQVAKIEQLQKEIEEFIMNKLDVQEIKRDLSMNKYLVTAWDEFFLRGDPQEFYAEDEESARAEAKRYFSKKFDLIPTEIRIRECILIQRKQN